MTPELTKIFNETFEENLHSCIENEFQLTHPKLVPALTEKFSAFMGQIGENEITGDAINAFVEKIEDKTLRDLVRIAIDTADIKTQETMEYYN